MKVEVEYRNSMAANQFGTNKLKEIIEMSDKATYRDLLTKLLKKYKIANKGYEIPDEKLEEMFYSNIMVTSNRMLVKQMEDEPIKCMKVEVGILIGGG